ncbi:class C beta-lactamase [Pseudomonas quasicaspiana]|uniref:class C beta-lactamase n=1 Tax=Pseudomonas quasicaspiana TaxID=2829821 RepID=UPI001E4F7B5F|nr:class C beta-lactamase [Pseudomonas quasicaspiana]MCD5972366.1 beta-lactamase [Pseudomonas quasicaspiana]
MHHLPQRVLLTCCLSLACITEATASNIDVQTAATRIMQQYNIPGMSIAVTVDGQQHFYNYGVASKDPAQFVTSDTLFELGSISKTFTATLASYAQTTGKLSLEDHPGKYLPQLKGSAFDQVTLINLATHTAGGFPLQVPNEVQNNEQLMAYLQAWQPQYPAGSKRTYANPSIGMLGMITAKAMNVTFENAMEQQLFPKLGLTNSCLNVPADKMKLYAQGYNKQDAPVRLQSGVLGNEAYGMKSSSKDLLHFIELNINPDKADKALAKAITDTHVGYFKVGEMTQDLIWEQYPYPATLETLQEGNSNKMAFETQPATALNPPLQPQNSVWINKTGSTNGFGGYVAFVPEKKVGIVILANKNYPNEARVKLAHEILQGLN